MYRTVAIVKPDHIGDLVLAAPAIAWVSRQSRSATLFVQRGNLPLARHLFPELACEPIDLDYLVKSAAKSGTSFFDAIETVAGFDVTIFLRSDHLLNRDNIAHLVPRSIFSSSNPSLHESLSHQHGIRPFFGDYERDDVWRQQNHVFTNAPARVGLCIGSGFPSNKWSIIKWAGLSNALREDGATVTLIGGEAERAELAILADVAGVADEDIVVGGSDLAGFLQRISRLDVVVSSDGGSGHLCSLAVPVLTVAASVPFRRFAPFGRANRVVSLDLPCSPCVNAHEILANGCFSYECSFGIQVEDVLEALHAPTQDPGAVRQLQRGARLFYAPSHAS